jgi:hypothetical protein
METPDNHTDDYDSPWKEGMELYFKELMQFFFPDIAAQISHGPKRINSLTKNCSRW